MMIVLAYALLAVAFGTLVVVVIPYGVKHYRSRQHTDGRGWYHAEAVHMEREIAIAHVCGYLPSMRAVSIYRDGNLVQTVKNSARITRECTPDAHTMADAERELPADLDVLVIEGAYRGRRGKVVDRAGNEKYYLLRVEMDLTHTRVEVIARTDFVTREEEPLRWN